MNNNEVKNVENKQNNSLMRKTKAQLVEIILRKDSIEKNLRTDINGTNSTLNEIRNKYNALEKYYDELNYDYRDMCDEKTFIEYQLNDKIKFLRKLSIGLIVCIIILVILNIILFLI